MSSSDFSFPRSSMSLRGPLVVLLSLVMMTVSQYMADENYCRLCNDHTMCLYRGLSNACQRGRTSGGVSKAEQIEIVDTHNYLRNKVAVGNETRGRPGPQPPADNMQLLSWDVELANIAQRWADQCVFDHDACRNVERFYVGQNLAQNSYSPCNNKHEWVNAIYGWYDEVADFDRSIVMRYRSGGPMTGHFTQLVWASTTKIGCGYRLYEIGTWCHSYYACNYGPGGNILSHPMYQVGKGKSILPERRPSDDVGGDVGELPKEDEVSSPSYVGKEEETHMYDEEQDDDISYDEEESHVIVVEETGVEKIDIITDEESIYDDEEGVPPFSDEDGQSSFIFVHGEPSLFHNQSGGENSRNGVSGSSKNPGSDNIHSINDSKVTSSYGAKNDSANQKTEGGSQTVPQGKKNSGTQNGSESSSPATEKEDEESQRNGDSVDAKGNGRSVNHVGEGLSPVNQTGSHRNQTRFNRASFHNAAAVLLIVQLMAIYCF